MVKKLEIIRDDIKIRFANLSDLAWLNRHEKWVSKSTKKQNIEQKQYIVVELNSKLIGALRYELWWGHLPFLAIIWVEDEYQKKGIGKSLLNFLEEYLRKNKYSKLLSSSDDSGAQKWHLKVGFKKSGYIDNLQKEKEVVFFKEL